MLSCQLESVTKSVIRPMSNSSFINIHIHLINPLSSGLPLMLLASPSFRSQQIQSYSSPAASQGCRWDWLMMRCHASTVLTSAQQPCLWHCMCVLEQLKDTLRWLCSVQHSTGKIVVWAHQVSIQNHLYFPVPASSHSKYVRISNIYPINIMPTASELCGIETS